MILKIPIIIIKKNNKNNIYRINQRRSSSNMNIPQLLEAEDEKEE